MPDPAWWVSADSASARPRRTTAPHDRAARPRRVANAAGVASIGGLSAHALGAAPGSPAASFPDYVHATAVTTTAVLALAVITGFLVHER